jgi:hypothetical protein
MKKHNYKRNPELSNKEEDKQARSFLYYHIGRFTTMLNSPEYNTKEELEIAREVLEKAVDLGLIIEGDDEE